MRSRIEYKTAAAPAHSAHVSRFKVKASEGADRREFTGLASTWDLDLGGDVIVKGAYKRTLGEWKDTERVIPLINGHSYYDTLNAVGKLVKAVETDEGLEATFRVVESPQGDEFLARIKDGIIDALSIGYEVRGFRPPNDAERKRGVQRVLTDVELSEVSLVVFPMNQNARIDTNSVKSIAAALAALKREQLTPDDLKDLRASAGIIGAFFRKDDQPPGEKPADAGDPAEPAPPPAAPPGDPADAPKGYANADALAQRIRRLRLSATANEVRTTLQRITV